jgi:hypothetical protein
MNPKTFIFCHDAEIVKNCINEGRFDLFDDCRWVMLGPRDFSSIAHIPDLIIARDLPDNIEHHRNLVAWTGWYALARNGYIHKGDIVNLFEYDLTSNMGQFRQMPQSAYFQIPVDVVPYWSCGDNYEPFIKTLTGKGAKEFYAESVPVTSNYTLTWDDAHLQLTLDCITKGLTDLTFVGHVLERAYSQHFLNIPIQQHAFKHAFANSHGF